MESLLSARLPLVPHSEAGSLTTIPGAGFSTSMLQDPPDLFREKKGAGRFDYIGFALLAIGVGALQVALDKGQEDDWFGSHFITTLIVIAAVGLVSPGDLGMVPEGTHRGRPFVQDFQCR